MTYQDFFLRLLAATFAGILIGHERQWNHRTAGLRINALVSIGACIFVLLSIKLTETGVGDVTRIIGQVVTGVGFLCAGIIFKVGVNIHGLTSAVTFWCCSAVGCLAGAGYLIETLIATGFVVILNVLLKPIDEWLARRKPD